jgi:hypothetical protein
MKGQRNSENLYEVVECFEMRCLEAAEGNRKETRPSLVCHPDFSHRELLKVASKTLNFVDIWKLQSDIKHQFQAISGTEWRLSLPARQEAKQR